MSFCLNQRVYAALLLGVFSASGWAAENHHNAKAQHAGVTSPVCQGFGPQTPRDIDNVAGENARSFSLAPSYQEMNLCNIHMHNNAEHKAKDFSIDAGPGEHGHGGGYQCSMSKSLSPAELQAPAKNACKSIKPGDTIEVHWVYSSCDVKPGEGLGSCMSPSCANPDLRVETQVFTVVNDPAALNFNTMTYDGNLVNKLHQAKSLPVNTGKPVEFMGSTTGPNTLSSNVRHCKSPGVFAQNAPRWISPA